MCTPVIAKWLSLHVFYLWSFIYYVTCEFMVKILSMLYKIYDPITVLVWCKPYQITIHTSTIDLNTKLIHSHNHIISYSNSDLYSIISYALNMLLILNKEVPYSWLLSPRCAPKFTKKIHKISKSNHIIKFHTTSQNSCTSQISHKKMLQEINFVYN